MDAHQGAEGVTGGFRPSAQGVAGVRTKVRRRNRGLPPARSEAAGVRTRVRRRDRGLPRVCSGCQPRNECASTLRDGGSPRRLYHSVLIHASISFNTAGVMRVPELVTFFSP
jgi:hypothetical protein